jgi:hypothetical protein
VKEAKDGGGYRGNHGKAVQITWTTLEFNPFSGLSVEYSYILRPGVAHSEDGDYSGNSVAGARTVSWFSGSASLNKRVIRRDQA